MVKDLTFFFFHFTGGHINPAVTVAFATLGKFPWKKVGHYLLAQHLGAFVASAVLYVNYKGKYFFYFSH